MDYDLSAAANDGLTVLLQGVVGSRAYGLDHADSDIDRMGIYARRSTFAWGLYKGNDTVVSHGPDVTRHEIGKYLALASGCNPTVLELLWLTGYEVLHPFAQKMIDERESFLTTKYITDAFRGYAMQQVKGLQSRRRRGLDGYASNTSGRQDKHGRHVMRLLWQGAALLSTGTMTLKVTPEQREYLFSLAGIEHEDLVAEFDKAFAVFDATESILDLKRTKSDVQAYWSQQLVYFREWQYAAEQYHVGLGTMIDRAVDDRTDWRLSDAVDHYLQPRERPHHDNVRQVLIDRGYKRGENRLGEWNDKTGEYWLTPGEPRRRLFLPTDSTFDDYPNRMEDILRQMGLSTAAL